MNSVRLKPILLEWLKRHYPKISSIMENQCYIFKQYPMKELIKKLWALMQVGYISTVFGVEGAVLDNVLILERTLMNMLKVIENLIVRTRNG